MRAIRTTDPQASCDVCGRTLLRGERAEVYLDGVTRRSVCELCTSRALNEGWVREGTIPAYDGAGSRSERRRSLFAKLRSKRGAPPAPTGPDEPELERGRQEPALVASRPREQLREPRHVRAVPTSVEHKVSSAVELFNSSEHRRTVAGVARSLGLPTVSVLPSASRASVVKVIASWELCWYRYEVDLSDDAPSVRVADQGYELDELAPEERTPNAVADENGRLAL
jgi:hypothetical protein